VDRVKKCGVEGNRMQDLHIEVRDQHRRHNARYQLKGSIPKATPRFAARGEARLFSRSAEGDYFQDQQKGPIMRAEFLTRALKAANDKARELGWIV
jgi:hypothetical protein